MIARYAKIQLKFNSPEKSCFFQKNVGENFSVALVSFFNNTKRCKTGESEFESPTRHQKEKHHLAMLFFLGFVAVVGTPTLRY